MEGTVQAPRSFQVRLAVAAILLAAFGVIAARLVPPYLHNYEFKGYLEETVDSKETASLREEMLRIRVIDGARRLGLPVQAGQVHISHSASGMSIDVRYVVPVDIYISTVILHFHTRAGAH
ncbi:MAG: hypothetical protein LLG20_08090 [Acidobacteriales bacterium]|nr:hypothetical protein [Terriglobales bacterium]